jgi:hypothetical protein
MIAVGIFLRTKNRLRGANKKDSIIAKVKGIKIALSSFRITTTIANAINPKVIFRNLLSCISPLRLFLLKNKKSYFLGNDFLETSLESENKTN